MKLAPPRSTVLGRAVTVLGLSIAAACTTAPIGNADGELVIGTLLPLSGPEADAGAAALAAVDQQIDEIGSASELSTSQIRVVHTDVRSDPALLQAAIDELTANNVDIVIGPPTATQDLRARELLAGAGSLVHLPLSQPLRPQVLMMADVLSTDGHQRVNLLVPNGLSSEIEDEFTSQFAKNDGTVASVVGFDAQAERFDPEAAIVAEDESTAVLIVGAEAPQLIIDSLEAVGAGPSNRTVYVLGSTDGVRRTVGVRLVEVGAPLADRMSDRTVVAALAASVAGTDDPASIADALGCVVGGDSGCASFANCLTLLRDSDDVRFEGSSANSFSADGNPVEVPYLLSGYTADGDLNEDVTRTITSG